MYQEQRMTARYSVQQTAEIGFGTETIIWSDVINLSGGGVMCRTPKWIEPATRVLISMILPNGAHVECAAIVLRSAGGDDENRCAMMFTSFLGSGPEDLLQYLDHLTTRGRAASHARG
jgi:PilZ domain